MSALTILHVIGHLGCGGAARAMVANAKEWQRLGRGRNQIVSLSAADRAVAKTLQAQGVLVLDAPDRDALFAAVAEADIVLVHYFNSPALVQCLAVDWPPCRAVLWCHVGGTTAAQALPSWVIAWADRLVLSTPMTLSAPSVRQFIIRGGKPRVIAGGADFERLQGIQPRPHTGFNVGYLGTLDSVKIHPDFIAMSAAIDVPQIRVVVCGARSSALEQEAARSGAADRFEFRGYVEDIRPILEVLDVFGYPLCADNYASSDQTVQEAMYAGVPPVVFPYGGVRDMILHNDTGLIVESPRAYASAIEHLAANPDERARLGRNARAHAEKHFGARRCAALFDALYHDLMGERRRPRRRLEDCADPGGDTTLSGAELFLQSLGGLAPEFVTSASATDRDAVREADRAIARASPSLRSIILQYSAALPRDPLLSLWAGLAYLAAGYKARALIKFKDALRTGGDEQRLAAYMTEIALGLGASGEAIATTIAHGRSAKPAPAPDEIP